MADGFDNYCGTLFTVLIPTFAFDISVQVIGPVCDNCSVSKLFSGSLAGKKHKMFPINSNVLI